MTTTGDDGTGMATIVVCGAGFLGSWFTRLFVQRLRNLNVDAVRFGIIDMDRFEERNLPTQYLSPRDLGRNKSGLSAKVCEDWGYPSVGIEDFLTLDNMGAIAESLGKVALVVDSFDNLGARYTAKQMSKKLGCPCLHLSMSENKHGKVEWDDRWSLDPEKALELIMPPEVKIEPCELGDFLPLGLAIAMRGVAEAVDFVKSGETGRSWAITIEEQKRL